MHYDGTTYLGIGWLCFFLVLPLFGGKVSVATVPNPLGLAVALTDLYLGGLGLFTLRGQQCVSPCSGQGVSLLSSD